MELKFLIAVLTFPVHLLFFCLVLIALLLHDAYQVIVHGFFPVVGEILSEQWRVHLKRMGYRRVYTGTESFGPG
jgi:hypothetical protein